MAASLSVRTRVRIARRRLDRELAVGVPPQCSPELALRALQLTRPGRLRGLAAALTNLIDAAEEPPGLLEREAPARAVNRAAVRRARADLERLAGRLCGEPPVSPAAAALAHLLVLDESGPLYGTSSPQAAIAHIEAVRRALGKAA